MPELSSPPMRPHSSVYGLFVLLCILSGCAGVESTRSANFNSRVSIIVIHHTTSNFEDSLRILTQPSGNPVSSHYLIPEPGDQTYGKSRVRVYQLVPETGRAWHAGVSYWAGKTGLNDQSIGIELVNQTWCHASDDEPDPYATAASRICFFPDFPDEQIDLLVGLLRDITKRNPDIRPTNIIGHADIAPDRKIDPGPRFPWQRLYRLGYGAWFDDETAIRYWERFRKAPLPILNVQQALHAYGYGIETTSEADQQTHNVLRAFQMHFRPSEVTGEATLDTTAILFALIEKYYPEQLDELLEVAPEEPALPPPAPEAPEGSDPTT